MIEFSWSSPEFFTISVASSVGFPDKEMILKDEKMKKFTLDDNTLSAAHFVSWGDASFFFFFF